MKIWPTHKPDLACTLAGGCVYTQKRNQGRDKASCFRREGALLEAPGGKYEHRRIRGTRECSLMWVGAKQFSASSRFPSVARLLQLARAASLARSKV